MSDKICCPKCGGTGEVLLGNHAPHLLYLLQKLRRYGPMTATQARAKVANRLTVCAMNNRLEDLRALGFVTRQKQGRQWLYIATE